MDVLPLAAEDFPRVEALLEAWFEGTAPPALDPVFFRHFGGYSVTEGDDLVGLLVGFRSQRNRDVAVVHLVAIHPDWRGRGIATNLYDRFERQARSWSCAEIEAMTTADNEAALSFHQARGFQPEPSGDWAGHEEGRILLRKSLGPVV